MTEHLREDRINDYVDDLLCREERAEAEQHLVSCDVCRAEVAALRNLAAGLDAIAPEVLPARDLLAGINQRIDAAAAQIETQSHVASAPRSRRHALRTLSPFGYQLAAAAVVLVAITAALTRVIVRRADSDVSPPIAAVDSTPGAGPRPVTVPVSRVDNRYGDEARELEAQLAKQRATLAPETVRLVEENLRVIDAALAEARAALRDDPNNAALDDLMRSAYEKKLDLLRHATQTRGAT